MHQNVLPLFDSRFDGMRYRDLNRLEQDQVIALARDILWSRATKGECLTSPAAMREYLQLRIGELEHEVFGILYLDNKHRVLDIGELFRGTIDGASVHPREVVKETLRRNAAAVVFYHNHPSGMAEPSRADQKITRRLVETLSLIDVRVLDHFVVTSQECMSFAEMGLL